METQTTTHAALIECHGDVIIAVLKQRVSVHQRVVVVGDAGTRQRVRRWMSACAPRLGGPPSLLHCVGAHDARQRWLNTPLNDAYFPKTMSQYYGHLPPGNVLFVRSVAELAEAVGDAVGDADGWQVWWHVHSTQPSKRMSKSDAASNKAARETLASLEEMEALLGILGGNHGMAVGGAVTMITTPRHASITRHGHWTLIEGTCLLTKHV